MTIPENYQSPEIDASGTVRVRDELLGEQTVMRAIANSRFS